MTRWDRMRETLWAFNIITVSDKVVDYTPASLSSIEPHTLSCTHSHTSCHLASMSLFYSTLSILFPATMLSCLFLVFSWDSYRIRITSDLSWTKNIHTHKGNFLYFISCCSVFLPFLDFFLSFLLFFCRFLLQIYRSKYLYANSFDSIRFNICLLSKQSIKLFDWTFRSLSAFLVLLHQSK